MSRCSLFSLYDDSSQVYLYVPARVKLTTSNRIFPLHAQFVFKPEPYSSTNVKTVHEELAKAMTAILKPSTDFLTSNKLLKVT